MCPPVCTRRWPSATVWAAHWRSQLSGELLGADERAFDGQTGRMDREGRQELHYRALEGDVPGIGVRLAAGDSIGLADRQGFTPLHFAAQQSQTEAVKALLDAGAPVDPQDRFGNTPLWRAVFNSRGHVATVRLLLDAGAAADTANEAGTTPRDLAARMGAEAVTALFDETR